MGNSLSETKEIQEEIVTEKLTNYNYCEIKHTDKLKKISIKYLIKLLEENKTNGSDMKALFCLFNTLFSATSEKKTKGLPFLNDSIRDYIKTMTLLSHGGINGNIYKTEFFSSGIYVMIKFPKNKEDIPEMLREYYIGIESINKLRYLTPIFVYTLGAFLCPESVSRNGTVIKNPLINGIFCQTQKTVNESLYILYENIPGDTLDLMLRNETINFKEWIILFFQLLLGLEVAQREIRFTHFDMHSENIIVRKCNTRESYNIHLDLTTYKVVNTKFIPVIIDFGSSSTFVDNTSVGSYTFNNYGQTHFMVPGHDMYKFIIYSAIAAKKGSRLQKEIMSILRFYIRNDMYNYDPYNIITTGIQGLNNAVNNYCADLITSNAAKYTPLMFIEWLIDNYSFELSPTIIEEKRVQYLALQYTDSINTYDQLFNYTKDTNEALQIAKKCIKLTPSYVISKYNITILKRFNQKLKNKDLELEIKRLLKKLEEIKNDLVLNDIDMLEKVFDIKTPDQNELNKCIDDLLNIHLKKISVKKDNIQKEKLVKKFELLIKYQEKIQPYLQFYFTILDLNLNHIFFNWIDKFESSDLYIFYLSNITQIQQTIRWSQTLIESRV